MHFRTRILGMEQRMKKIMNWKNDTSKGMIEQLKHSLAFPPINSYIVFDFDFEFFNLFLGCEKEVATHFSTVGIYFGLVGPFKRKTHRGHGLPSPPKQKLHNGCHKITKKRSKSGGSSAGNFLPHLHPNSVRIFSVL